MKEPAVKNLDVLYEDNHLLVVNKPSGIATMGAESGPTIHSMAADYLKRTYNKPGKAFVGIMSRLDSMTSGVLVLARTSKAASRLSEQFAAKREGVSKIYLAVVSPSVDSDKDNWTDWVRKDDSAKRMRVVDSSAKDAKQARLQFCTLGTGSDHSLVAVQLLTGRKHQIRVQFADRGHPVIGDRKYGSLRPFSAGVALHSWRLQIVHPTRREPMWFTAGPPPSWKPFRGQLSSQVELWQQTCESLGL
jgi:23S rRNA pseudouridine1911/1915/1917 synthase